MAADAATTLPVMTFASGPTNSMRGAAFLSGLADAMVVDVGGTSTDIGQLRRGFPREANSVVEVGGVRTLFRMPDLLSVGLGGGSVIDRDPLTVGPQSVGYRLTRGGAGLRRRHDDRDRCRGRRRDRRNRRRRPGRASAARFARRRCWPRRASEIEDAVDRMKTEAGDLPLIAVGGGAFLVPDRLAGVSRVIRVAAWRTCANAVGAAIAQVSGETDQIYRDLGRGEAIAAAEAQARQRAIAAGADAETVETVDVEDMPLAYLPGNALRVRVRVAGEMRAADDRQNFELRQE